MTRNRLVLEKHPFDLTGVRVLDGESVRPYLQDESKLTGSAERVLIVRDEQGLASVLQKATEEHVPVTVSARRTGVVGGAVPDGGWVLSLEGMDEIIGIGEDDDGFFIRVQPNVTLRQLDGMLRRANFQDLKELTPGAISNLKTKGRHFYPVDPTESNASLGANAACNSSGSRSYRYGPTRGWVRRMRVVLADGSVIDIRRGEVFAEDDRFVLVQGDEERSVEIPGYRFNDAVKNSAGIFSREGMDAIDLFIGSEGVLGVISLLEVRVIPWRPMLSCMAFVPNDDGALRLVEHLKAMDEGPELIEFIDGDGISMIKEERDKGKLFSNMPDFPLFPAAAVMFDIPFDEGLVTKMERIGAVLESAGSSLNHTWCAHEERERERFRAFRHAIPEAVFSYIASRKLHHPEMHKMGTDISVPDESSAKMMRHYRDLVQRSGLRAVMFGHLGDNHPHLELLIEDMDDYDEAAALCGLLAEKAVSLGGCPSAEHGIGRLKKGYLRMMYDEAQIHSMVKVKRQLDRNWILNPGVLLEAGG